jgi:hypothetical protein
MTDAPPDRLPSRTRQSVTKAVSYLRRKQSYNGAFCFYKCQYLDQPNLRDTYHAIAALRLWGTEVPRANEVAQYLNSTEVSDVSGLFYYAFALDSLGRASLIEESHLRRIRALPLKRREFAGRVPIDSWLERTLLTLQLKCRFAELPDTDDIVREIVSLKCQGGYGEPPTLRDTRLSLSILALFGEKLITHDDTRAFVDGLQKPSIGFTDTDQSLHTSLDIVADGIQCCTMLKLPIRHAADVLAFVMACQAADGSFSRVSVALPDIALTHQALEIIRWLDCDVLSRCDAEDR